MCGDGELWEAVQMRCARVCYRMQLVSLCSSYACLAHASTHARLPAPSRRQSRPVKRSVSVMKKGLPRRIPYAKF
jgi:hypothetical protein